MANSTSLTSPPAAIQDRNCAGLTLKHNIMLKFNRFKVSLRLLRAYRRSSFEFCCSHFSASKMVFLWPGFTKSCI